MNFVRHQFDVNYMRLLIAREHEEAINMLLGELADWITTDPQSFASMLASSGVKVSSDNPVKLTDAFLKNLRGNSMIHAQVINKFSRGSRNPKAFAKAISQGLNAIVGSHYDRTDKKVRDYYKVLELKVKNYSKKIADADGKSSMEDNTSDEKPKDGQIVITYKKAINYLTIGLAIYGAYHLILFINGKIKDNARKSLAAQGNGGGTMAAGGQPIIIQQPAAVQPAPVQPAAPPATTI